MNMIVPFKVPVLQPGLLMDDSKEIYCGDKKSCCKKFKKGNRCKKCPGRKKIS